MFFKKIKIKNWLIFFQKKEDDSLKETAYLLFGKNGKILLESIKELEERKGFKKTFID
ncbi:hypothetical protein JL193_11760 [Polaribacter batillariae]|uniref:Uncharacterized protein n=1 Tax=Polaribacter batillariae TaxID=2808900 RepID=A0ABX7SRD5_9FLAO|nr:hypothetical protein [Polaribacter batillariae]QTD36805.1 hypothetical protein JL193_11760 [Polaribacter batillariae]